MQFDRILKQFSLDMFLVLVEVGSEIDWNKLDLNATYTRWWSAFVRHLDAKDAAKAICLVIGICFVFCPALLPPALPMTSLLRRNLQLGMSQWEIALVIGQTHAGYVSKGAAVSAHINSRTSIRAHPKTFNPFDWDGIDVWPFCNPIPHLCRWWPLQWASHLFQTA